MRPRRKPFACFRRGDVLVFQPDVGDELHINDPLGQVHHLVDLLDGSRTVPEVCAAMQLRWPDLTPEDVRAGIEGLSAARLVDDSQAPARLSDQQYDRFSRNLAFFGSYATVHCSRQDLQDRLLRAHVLLLGVGGVGGAVLMSLAGLGVGHVTVVDCDTVELKNLNRQFLYREADIGQDKIDCAVAFARALHADMRVTPVRRRIASTDDVASLLPGVDLVITAIDEPPILVDRWVNAACVDAGVPVVAGGVRVTRALYFSMQPGQSGCLQCLEMAQAGDAPQEVDPALSDEIGASVGPAVTLVAGLMGMEALRYLTGFAPPAAAGKIWLVDLKRGPMDVAREWARRADCPVCGEMMPSTQETAQLVAQS